MGKQLTRDLGLKWQISLRLKAEGFFYLDQHIFLIKTVYIVYLCSSRMLNAGLTAKGKVQLFQGRKLHGQMST